MLNSVRYGGFFDVIRNVHWLHALVAPTIIVWLGPRMISDRKSTAYDTDMVEPLRASGRFTLKADVIDDTSSSVTNHAGCAKVWNGNAAARRNAPMAMMAATYTWAALGSCLIAPRGSRR